MFYFFQKSHNKIYYFFEMMFLGIVNYGHYYLVVVTTIYSWLILEVTSFSPMKPFQFGQTVVGGLKPFGLKKRPILRSSSSGVEEEYKVLDCIGSGSYGTVHVLESCSSLDGEKEPRYVIGKRAWTEQDLKEKEDNDSDDSKSRKERQERCQYYWQVEQHCFEKKLQPSQSTVRGIVPQYLGTYNKQWMLFELLSQSSSATTTSADQFHCAKSLAQVISEEWVDQHRPEGDDHHHLYLVQQQLGLTNNDEGAMDDGFTLTLDCIITSLLTILSRVHEQKIVHRDIKPANLLLIPTNTNSNSSEGDYDARMCLIDFGSAADMEPIKTNFGFGKKYVGLEDPSRVAVSPNYVAPELYIQPSDKDDAYKFDVYSAALIIFQLLLNYLDEVTDAGFNQQLALEAQHDLDVWLSKCELSKKVRPDGLEDALQYLSIRPGLWNLLQQMLQPNPYPRISSSEALYRWKTILQLQTTDDSLLNTATLNKKEERKWLDDGKFFKAVIQNFEQCEIPLDDDSEDIVMPRPLHYVTTFQRKMPLGLVLSEVDDIDESQEDFELDPDSIQKWNEATKNAQPGEVYVRYVVPMGQADLMGGTKGIIEVGDQLQGVGELPLMRQGFGRVLELLEDQPTKDPNIRIHFDRIKTTNNIVTNNVAQSDKTKITAPSDDDSHSEKRKINIAAMQQGTWSVLGQRKAQEDRFVLHEIHDGENHNKIVLAGVFDGHGGKAASQTASQLLPSLVTSEIMSSSLEENEGGQKQMSLKDALQKAWETTCTSYRSGCDSMGEQCIADYDPREGILMASTGSKDMFAGTTASMAIFDETEMFVLNCGDSRTLLIGSNNIEGGDDNALLFVTRDHSPSSDLEMARLQRGRDEGLDYSLPECSMSRWTLKVGDYRYALSRSLEGSFTTSKGIVSDADITDLSSLAPSASALLIASDGLFDVMDNEEVAQNLLEMKNEQKLSASDAAKSLCRMALNKGTADNVSVVVLYLN